MAGWQTLSSLTTLRSKQVEIEKHIDELNLRLSDARTDLVHVVACMSVFDPKRNDDTSATAYYGIVKALKRAEMFVLCKAALDAAGAGEYAVEAGGGGEDRSPCERQNTGAAERDGRRLAGCDDVEG